jgi:hypothetical protein
MMIPETAVVSRTVATSKGGPQGDRRPSSPVTPDPMAAKPGGSSQAGDASSGQAQIETTKRGGALVSANGGHAELTTYNY